MKGAETPSSEITVRTLLIDSGSRGRSAEAERIR
jgi:hypothetical protein